MTVEHVATVLAIVGTGGAGFEFACLARRMQQYVSATVGMYVCMHVCLDRQAHRQLGKRTGTHADRNG